MAVPTSSHETLVLDVLKSQDTLTMEQMKTMLPQLNWWELLHTVDVLSRRGDLILRRKGFDYEVQSAAGIHGAAGQAAHAPDQAGGDVTQS